MITNENKLFLKEYFEIDFDKYEEKEINIILDNILQSLEENIKEKKLNILKSMKDIVTIVDEINNN